MKDCLPREGPHTGTAAETTCDKLIKTSIPCLPPLVGEGCIAGKEEGVEGRCF